MTKPAPHIGPKQPPDISASTLSISRRRVSQYRELVKRLIASPKNSAIRIKNLSEQLAIRKHAHALGYETVFAEHEGWLYIRIGRTLKDEPRRTRPGLKGAEKSVLNALSNAPLTAAEVARILRSDSASCDVILSRLVKAGIVERDDGLGRHAIYRAVSGGEGVE